MKDLDLAYEECRLITRREAKNFYYAFVTLPPKKRRAIYAAYAFCRLCDDSVDQDVPISEKLRLLDELRERLSATYSGNANGPVFTALAHAIDIYEIPEEYFQEVVSGVEMDLTKSRYQDFDELRTYCYRVASVVGLICIQIFGYSNVRAKEYAVDLGLAMQLTNILRDIKEDMDRDRVYLPLNEMEDYGCSIEDMAEGVVNQPFLDFMSFQNSEGPAILRERLQATALPFPPLPGMSRGSGADIQPHPGPDRSPRFRRFQRPRQSQQPGEVHGHGADLDEEPPSHPESILMSKREAWVSSGE